MDYIIAIFLSRSETLAFASMLKNSKIPSAVISTPQSLARTCGISVKFCSSYLDDAKKILSKSNLNSFKGFFKIIFQNGQRILKQV